MTSQQFPVLRLDKTDKHIVEQPLGRLALHSDKRYKNYTQSIMKVMLEQIQSGCLNENIKWPEYIIECDGKRYHYGNLHADNIKSQYLENLYQYLYADHLLGVYKKQAEEDNQKRRERIKQELKTEPEEKLDKESHKEQSMLEVIMKNILLEKGVRFIRQFKYGLGACSADFYIPPNIIIECDGLYYHAAPWLYEPDDIMINGKTAEEVREIDQIKTEYLQSKHYKVIRFWEHEINEKLDYCVKKVLAVICSFTQNSFSQTFFLSIDIKRHLKDEEQT